jgi:8-oxo-dGTP pyrophosphatase MutT (NUDIX family)
VLRFAPLAEVLAFRHLLAGLQLVKGTIEADESPRDAALRELQEESGIPDATLGTDLGIWNSGYQGQIWSFHRCHVERRLPNEWVHRAEDDGRHDFKFFWHPLAAEASTEWPVVFQRAVAHIRGLGLAVHVER